MILLTLLIIFLVDAIALVASFAVVFSRHTVWEWVWLWKYKRRIRNSIPKATARIRTG